MKINTHLKIDQTLCGTPVRVDENTCTIEMATHSTMAADDKGLIHGGFVFGMADYAAMVAVNDPNVVLGGANVKFLKPVKVGDTLKAEARVTSVNGKKNTVSVSVMRNSDPVFEGEFVCFVLPGHVLDT